MTWLRIGVGVLALALSVGGGLWVVPAVLRAAARSGDDGHRERADDDTPRGAEHDPENPGPVDTGPTSDAARAALRGGTWIGILERFALTACLLAGFGPGVAVVVAVKALGRYPELRENPGVSERFVVGTLASLVWAGLAGWLGAWVAGRIG